MAINLDSLPTEQQIKALIPTTGQPWCDPQLLLTELCRSIIGHRECLLDIQAQIDSNPNGGGNPTITGCTMAGAFGPGPHPVVTVTGDFSACNVRVTGTIALCAFINDPDNVITQLDIEQDVNILCGDSILDTVPVSATVPVNTCVNVPFSATVACDSAVSISVTDSNFNGTISACGEAFCATT